jgi:hypothetical protein
MKSFYLPELVRFHPRDFPVHIILNKTDLGIKLTRRQVLRLVQQYYPSCQLSVAGRSSKKNNGCVAFRIVMRNLINDNNDESCKLFGFYVSLKSIFYILLINKCIYLRVSLKEIEDLHFYNQ